MDIENISDEPLNEDLDSGVQETSAENVSARRVDNSGYVNVDDLPEEDLVRDDQVESEEELPETDEQEGLEEYDNDDNQSDDYEEDDSEFFTQLSEEVGLEISDAETLIATLLDAKEIIEKSKEDVLADIPSELRLAIEVAKSGGDYKEALNVLSMDFDKLDSKEVLRQKFYRENQDLVKKDKEFADMKFERDYDSKYGVLSKEFADEYEKEEFLAQNKRDIDFANKSLQREVEDSKEFLNDWKSQYADTVKQPQGLSETERQAIIDKHTESVSKVLDEFEGTFLSIDDNPENDFLVGLTDESKETLKEVMSDPRTFLSDVIGINYETGAIDYEKLAMSANVLLNIDNLGSALRQYSIEKKNKETVEGMMTNPRTRKSADHARQPIEDEGLAVGRAIRQQLYGRR